MNYGRTSLRRRAKQLDARGTRIRHKIGVILGKLLLIGIIVGGCATVSFGVGAFKGILASAPDISEVDVIPTGYSTKVLAADGSETAKLVAAGSNRQYVTIDQIPENLQHAVVAIEDERFYDHNGIDLKGIVRALVADVRTRDFSQGASTLTQQLIKNNVLSEQWANENDSNISKMEKMERQVQRKIQEQYLAIELEKKVNDKNWILENYLNSINLGSNTLGVQAAAQRYFGKDVSKLTLSECAVIAGITKNPAGYNPILHPKENAKRRKNVLDAMKKQGYISQKQYDKAMADDVYGRISEHNDVREETMNTYFVDAVIDDVFDDLVNIKGYSESEAYKAIYQGGLTIKSTQNLQIQKICDEEGIRMSIDLALEKLIPGLQEIYGDLIDSVILYGSTARGTQTADSDVDVAILLRAGATKVMRDQMLDLVVDLELACGKVLSVLCIDYDKFAEWKDVLPFYKNIRKDGVVLWQAA